MLAVRPVWPVPPTPADTAGQAGIGNILEHLGNFLSTSIPPLHFHLEELKLQSVCRCQVTNVTKSFVKHSTGGDYERLQPNEACSNPTLQAWPNPLSPRGMPESHPATPRQAQHNTDRFADESTAADQAAAADHAPLVLQSRSDGGRQAA